VSRVDDGARSLDGLTDRGITAFEITRASHLRPGQKLLYSRIWHTLTTVDNDDGTVTAKSATITWTFPEAEMVEVRDILHTYTESDTP
jgi:hypothetical protein